MHCGCIMPVVVRKIFGAKQKGKRSIKLLKEIRQMQKFDEMPEGWKLDTTWGSPEHGWTPICNGKSILNGGLKGLLRLNKQAIQEPVSASTVSISIPEVKRELTKEEAKEVALAMNKLAREKFKEKLMQEILFDLSVCKIEGWPIKQYVNDLKNLIDDVFRRMNKGSAKNPSYNKRLPVRAVPSPLPNSETGSGKQERGEYAV